MDWMPFDIGRIPATSHLLLLFLCVGQTPREISAYAECKEDAHLHFFTKTVEQKGFRYEKLEVNRSHPVSITYRVFIGNSEVDSVNWKHNGQEINVEDNPKLTLYYAIDRDDVSLSVTLNATAPNARSTGAWTMTLITNDEKEHSAVCHISSPPILRTMPGASRANVGSSLSVTCPLESVSSNVMITWKRVVESENGQKQLKPVENVIFKSEGDVTNSIMEWSDATDAAGLYLCAAASARGNDSTLIEVRIRDYKTYLWPSVGILIEVVLLAITIAAYEITQSKKRKAEQSETRK